MLRLPSGGARVLLTPVGQLVVRVLQPLPLRRCSALQAFRPESPSESQASTNHRQQAPETAAAPAPQALPPALYLVGTPIGNLADLSPRARSVLAGVDVIFAEDTRHTAKLLSFCNIHTTLHSLNSQSEAAKTEQVLQYLQQHRPVALVSDAGETWLDSSVSAEVSGYL